MFQRSKDIEGLKVRGSDGDVGPVVDLLADDNWVVRYLVVTARAWLDHRVVISPIGGTHVLLPTAAVRDGRPVNAELDVDLPVERVRTAPEYDAAKPLDGVLEQKIRAHFGLGFEPKPAPRRSARRPVGL